MFFLSYLFILQIIFLWQIYVQNYFETELYTSPVTFVSIALPLLSCWLILCMCLSFWQSTLNTCIRACMCVCKFVPLVDI